MFGRLLAAALLAGLSPASGAARADAPLPTVSGESFASTPLALSNGVQGSIISFESRTPTDWAPAIRGDTGPAVTLNAQLFLPARQAGKLPAIIVVPGSGNIGTHHLAEAAALNSAGYAVLIIDPFRGRGIADTITDQGRLTWVASTYDVLAAVRYLQSRSDIDPARIGALGGSRGGTAVMMAAAAPFAEAVLGPGKGLRAVVAGYPWCGTQFQSARLSGEAALLVLQGDRDDWVSVQQCQDAVHAMIVGGQAATMRIVPGALHAFDRADVPPTPIPQAVTSTIFPTIYMTDAGVYFDPRTGQADPALTAKDFTGYAAKAGFGRKGVTIGSRPGDAETFMTEMTAFFVREL